MTEELTLSPRQRSHLERVLARYGLRLTAVSAPAGCGRLHLNLIAHTDGLPVFVKRYRHACADKVAAEHALAARVAGQGLPAVAPLPTQDGASYVWEEGLWAVYPVVEGVHLAPSAWADAHVREVGRTLGQVHAALRTHPADRLPEPARPWLEGEATLRAHQRLLARIPPEKEPFDRLARDHLELQRRLLASGEARGWQGFQALPWQAIHGDVYADNLLFGPDGRLRALLDWEKAALRPRAWELARAAFLLFFGATFPEEGVRRTRLLLAGYAEESPLRPEEVEALPELLFSFLAHDVWKYEEHYLAGRREADELAWEDHAALRYLAAHRQELARALVRGLPVNGRRG